MKIFDDGGQHTNLWFELEPNLFWCGSDEVDAQECRRMLPRNGASEERLHEFFGDGVAEVQRGEV